MEYAFGSLVFLFSIHALMAQQTPINSDTLFDSDMTSAKSRQGSRQGQDQDLVEVIYKECEGKVPGSKDFQDDNSEKVKAFNACVEEYLGQNQERVKTFQKKKVGRGSERMPLRRQRSVEQEYLSKYLKERFEEKVRKVPGEEGAQRVVDHAYYFDLYQSQLSKIVTTTINSYCMYADTIGWSSGQEKEYFNFVPKESKEKRAQVVEANKKRLNNPREAKIFIEICATGITKVCHDEEKGDSSSKVEACRTLENLRKLNRAITANQERIDYMWCQNKFEGGKHCEVSGFENVVTGPKGQERALQFYNPSVKEQGIDDLTALTSREFQKNVIDKIEQVCPKNQEPSEECLKQLKVITSNGQGQLPGDGDDGKGQEEEDKKVLAEFQIQSLIVQNAIEGHEKEDMAREISMEGGGDIERVIEDIESKSQEQIKALRIEMKERYERERKASLKNLALHLASRGGASGVGADGEVSNRDIVESIRNKGKRLGQLLFFNNIITSYLEVKSGGTGVGGEGVAVQNNSSEAVGVRPNVRRNLASSRRELKEFGKEEGASLGIGDEFVQDLKKHLSKFEEEEGRQGQGQGQRRGPTVYNPTFSPGQVYREIIGDPKVYKAEGKEEEERQGSLEPE